MKVSADQLKPVILLMVTAYWFSLYLHVPIQAPHLEKMGLMPSLVGVIIGAYGLAQALLRIPLGVRCDCRGRLFPYLLLGAAMIPVSALLRFLGADSAGMLLLSNLVGGVAAAMWIVILALMGNLFAAEDLHRAMSYALTGNSLGMLSSTLGCAVLAAPLGFAGLGAVELGGGLLALTLAVWVARAAQKNRASAASSQAPQESQKKEYVRKILCNRRLWAFSILAFVHQGLILSTVLSFAPARAKSLGASSLEVGIAVFLFWIVTVAVTHATGKAWMMKGGARLWLPLALGLAALYCFLMGRIQSVTWLYPLQMMGGIFGGIVIPFSMSEALAEVPLGCRTTGIGVFQAVLAAGLVVLPPVAGLALQKLGQVGGFSLLAGIALLAALWAYLLPNVIFRAHKQA